MEFPASAWPALPPPRNIPLTTLPPHVCSYLPDRIAQMRGVITGRIAPEVYQQFMDAGFRRSGRLIYQPVCAGCRECRPIRVPVATFRPSKAQRRAWKRNQDLIVTIAAPQPTQEKFELYAHYVREWHQRDEENATPQGFVSFLYESPVETIEFSYRDPAGRLLGVGLCDLCAPTSLSSVYFYFDPREAARGLGTFSSLYEIEFARARGLAFYYLGYWIAGCHTMRYKSSFRPYELLDTDGAWRAQSGTNHLPPTVENLRRPDLNIAADE